jgi:DNA-binding NtrC family response regulator
MEIHIPALRERPEDILPMASQFMAEFSDRRARFSPAVAGCLEQYKWPGNVRELRNAMERAAMLCPGETIMPEHLPARIRQTESDTVAPPASADSRLENIERHAILQALRECNYNRTETARALGISRRALLYKLGHLRELGFAIDSDQPGASNNPETAS